MCEGTADVVRGVERSLAEKIVRQYRTKYGRTYAYRPTPEQYEKGHAFRVTASKIVVFDLHAFAESATRFTFGSAEG